MTDDQVHISFNPGADSNLTVYQKVMGLTKQNSACYIWAEPLHTYMHEGKAEPLPDFTPFVEGMPLWEDWLPLTEAKIFWKSHAVFLVAEHSGCRWTVLKEHTDEQNSVTVQSHTHPVYTLQDARRFGLNSASWAQKKLEVVEYTQAGKLLAWRLIYPEQN